MPTEERREKATRKEAKAVRVARDWSSSRQTQNVITVCWPCQEHRRLHSKTRWRRMAVKENLG